MDDYLRGHKIECVNGRWFFSDTGEPTIDTWENRPCGHCGRENTIEGHDGCLGTLKGVMNACCGHGQEKEAYVQFRNGEIIDGIKAIEYFKKQGMYYGQP